MCHYSDKKECFFFFFFFSFGTNGYTNPNALAIALQHLFGRRGIFKPVI